MTRDLHLHFTPLYIYIYRERERERERERVNVAAHVNVAYVRKRPLDVLVTYIYDKLVALKSIGIRLELTNDKYPLSYWLFHHRLPLTKSKYW